MNKKTTPIFVLILLTLLVSCGKSVEQSFEEDQEIVDSSQVKIPFYPIVSTNQTDSFDKDGNIIEVEEGQEYYGQDADYESNEFSFTKNDDGTTTDNTTGLMWQTIVVDEKMSWEEAIDYCESLELAGYDDWRLPSVKELFSISDFKTGWPYIDLDYFEFPSDNQDFLPSMDFSSTLDNGMPQGGPTQGGGPQGGPPQSGKPQGAPPQGSAPQETGQSDISNNNMSINEMPSQSNESEEFGVSKAQGQYWSSNFYYVGTTHDGAATAFGVNHTTGHIKGYPSDVSGQMGKYVRAVRDIDENIQYGENIFVDNGDGTITDEATNLMWMQVDAQEAMDWSAALEYAQSSQYAGYSNWRLPDVKELQSIVDYSGVYPAIDSSYFETTELDENENYYYWTSTSAYFSPADDKYGYAWYVAFGYAVDDNNNDTHGAGAVRFSPKYENSESVGEGGDNVLNSVRLVRNIE